MKHQIILLGKDITSLYHGIKEFLPDVIHLLCTDQTKDIYQPLIDLLPANIKYAVYHIEPYNLQQVIDICRQIHLDNPGEYSYNLSEGTKPMAIAAYKVAMENKAKPFYFTQTDECVHLDTYEVAPIQSTLDNEELLKLSGNQISQYHDAKLLTEQDIHDSWAIKEFIEKHFDSYTRIQKFYGIYCRRHLENLPASQMLGDDLRIKQNNGTVHIMQANHSLLRVQSLNGCMLFYAGRWWETLVAEQVKQWTTQHQHTREVWQSVIFQTAGEKPQMKNEIDVLLNDKQKLIFIECKSGMVTSNDIYKIDAVRETYGGNISQAVLASYRPVDESIEEKCKDLQIYCFAPKSNRECPDFIRTLPQWLEKISENILL